MSVENAFDEQELDIFYTPIDPSVSDPDSPSPAPEQSSISIPHLNIHLRTRFFGLFEEADAYLQQFALENGFAITIRRSKRDIVTYYKCD